MRIGQVLVWSGRLLRRRWGARTLLLATVASLAGTLAFLGVNASRLSPGQQADQQLGTYAATVRADGLTGPLGPRVQEWQQAAIRAGTDVEVVWDSIDIETFGGTRYEDQLARYSEFDWAREPFPGSFVLESGRWPTSPGEVAINSPLADKSEDGRLSVLSGSVTFDVVGTFTPRYQFNRPVILAAPGTWDSLIEPLREDFPSLAAMPGLMFPTDDAARIEAVAQAAGIPLDDSHPVITRASIEAAQPGFWHSEVPWASTWLAFLLGFASLWMGFGLTHASLRVSNRAASAVGDYGRSMQWAHLLALATWCALGLVLGATLAALVQFPARPVLSQGIKNPLGEPMVPLLPLVWGAGGLVAALVGTLALRPVGGQERDAPASRVSAQVRDSAAILLLVGTLLYSYFVGGAFWVVAAVGFTTVGLLVGPHIIAGMGRALAMGKPTLARTWVARQFTTSTPAWSSVFAMLTLAIMLPLLTQGMARAILQEQKEEFFPDAGPGQVVVQAEGGMISEPPAKRPLEAVTAMIGSQPHRLRRTADQDRVVVDADGSLKSILVLNDAAAVEDVLGVPLSGEQRGVFDQGGLLTFYPGTAVFWITPEGQQRVEVNQVAVAPMSPWHVSFGGVVSRAGADAKGWPISEELAAIFADVSPEQMAAVQEGVRTGGLNRHMVVWNSGPKEFMIPPLVQLISLVPLVVLGPLLWVALSALVRRLRPQIARLRAIGVPLRWAGNSLVLAVVLICVTAIAVSLLCIAMAWWLRGGEPGAVGGLPSLQVTVWITLAVLAIAVVSTVASLRGLGTRERLS